MAKNVKPKQAVATPQADNALAELNSRINPMTPDIGPGRVPDYNPQEGQVYNQNTVTNPTPEYGSMPQGPATYDGSGMPKTKNTETNLFVEQGLTGLTRFGGFVYEEWLTELQGKRGALTYREMRDNDAVIGAFTYTIEMLLRTVKWRVAPAGNTPQDIEAAQFLESCLHDMSITWHDTISEILTFLHFGWCYMELCYKKRMGPDQENGIMRSKYNDGRIGWKKFSTRAQETLWRWRFDYDGTIRGMEQISPPDYKLRYIPIEKALLFRTKSNLNNPEGRSILRNAYRSWFFKKSIEEIEAIGIERDLAGFPIVWLPPEIFDQKNPEAVASYNKWKKIITNIKRDEQEGLMMPLLYDEKGNKQYDISMLSASTGASRRQFDTNIIIQRYENRIAMACLADFLMLGHEKGGSYALGKDKTSMFQTALTSVLQNMADTINTYAIPRLFKLNTFKNLTDYPKIVHNEIEKVDIVALSTYVKDLTGVGALDIMEDKELENYLRQVAALPLRDDYLDTPTIPIANSDTILKEDTLEREEFMKAVRKLRKEIDENG